MESHKEDHPCELNQAHLGHVKGVWVWHKFPTSHICSWKVLLSLSMSSPPSDPSVLIRPSCRVFSFLSFSCFPLMGGRDVKKKKQSTRALSFGHFCTQCTVLRSFTLFLSRICFRSFSVLVERKGRGSQMEDSKEGFNSPCTILKHFKTTAE